MNVTSADIQMLQAVRAKADELAHAVKQAADAGFTVQFNINGAIGSCDIFNVFKMVPVDMRGAAN